MVGGGKSFFIQNQTRKWRLIARDRKIIFAEISTVKPVGTGNANSIDSDEEKTLQVAGTEVEMLLSYCKTRNCTLTVFTGKM